MNYIKNLKLQITSRVTTNNFCNFNNFVLLLVGTCLVMLLQQDLLKEPEQKLVAITLIYELYRGESLANTPFANVFNHLLVCHYSHQL